MNSRHGGNLRSLSLRAHCDAEDLIDFSANMNPLGPPPSFRATVARAMDSVLHYPDPDSTEFIQTVATAWGCPERQIVAGNGSSELLFALMRALPQERVVIPVPCYVDYITASERAGKTVEPIALSAEENFAVCWESIADRLNGNEAVLLGRPNNPTGCGFPAETMRTFAEAHPKTLFIVDEAFIDFVSNAKSMTEDRPPNVVVLRSLTKFYAVPGLRLGLAVASDKWATAIRRQLAPWSVNALAQEVGIAALAETEYAHQTRERVDREREFLREQLAAIEGLTVFPGQANYLLLRLSSALPSGTALASRLLKQRIAIRVCDNYIGLDESYIRLAVRTPEENRQLIDALKGVLFPARRQRTKRPTPAIMFQGTSSNAGKSVLAAAMCRILLQDGVRVAPFKSQNMSLNSFVTPDGGEMGRAQVVQAQACRLEPDVRMNPILLKPNSDTGSQIIVSGKPVGNMRVGEYIRYKPEAFEVAKQCYESLGNEFDAIVLEGAGSPAEINLKHHDIVNMAMAHHAKSPVLLVGDIDRGGVFASFVGTMELLDAADRRRVAGFVINRFRGDASLLSPAIDSMRAFTGKETFGIVPYIRTLGLPEEDSVEFKSGALDTGSAEKDSVDIAVIDLPHISNFTDFDALRIESDVHLRIVREASQLGNPDAVLLPGSKNTLGDLTYLKQSGFADTLVSLSEAGTCEVVGICGGFQMLGTQVSDPEGVESDGGQDVGLGLLPVATTLGKEKTLSRASLKHLPTGLRVDGYEIHHGQTLAESAERLFQYDDGTAGGFSSTEGRVWGTYLHGLFDADEFRRWWIDRLRQRKGLAPVGSVQCTYDIDFALDRLAGIVRESLDIRRIYEVMGL